MSLWSIREAATKAQNGINNTSVVTLMAASARPAANKLFASSIMHTYNPRAGLVSRLYNRALTSFYLSQLKGSFIDFAVTSFQTNATGIYAKLRESAKKNDRGGVESVFTQPNCELIRICLKNNKPLPYQLYPTLESAKVVHCRMTFVKENQVESESFAHITVLFNCVTDTGERRVQYGIFERRLDNRDPQGWKIAYIDEDSPDSA